MEARIITKNIEVEGRRFVVKKYTARDGLKVAKLILAKIIPIFQDFVPLIKKMTDSKKSPIKLQTSGNDTNASSEMVSEVIDNFSLDTIAAALDKISEEDFDFIVTKSLKSISEVLPAGEAPVMYDNGVYGVEGIEYDTILVLRLTCEAVMWSCGDFFDGNRLGSVMSPLFNG